MTVNYQIHIFIFVFYNGIIKWLKFKDNDERFGRDR